MTDAIVNQGANITYTFVFSNLAEGKYSLFGMGAFHGEAYSGNFGDNNDFISSTLSISVTGSTTPITMAAQVYTGTEWGDGGAAVAGNTLTMNLTNASDKGYFFNIDSINVEEGGSFTVAITGSSASEYARMPLNMVRLTVPEPATATLSLLALAGIAARRRRK